jgi:hypothetical protein
MTSNRSHPAWRTAFAVLVAAMLSGCAGVTIMPVDHSCSTNPQINEGSGCSHSAR